MTSQEETKFKALMKDPTNAEDRAILDDMNHFIKGQITSEIILS